MNPRYIRILAITAAVLPVISLFLPFQVVTHEYFDEDTGTFIYVGTDFYSGFSMFHIIFLNYIIMGLLFAAGFTGKTIANKILTVLLIIAGIPFYSVLSGFLTHDWGATNSSFASWHYGWYIMLFANILLAVACLLHAFGKRQVERTNGNDLLDNEIP